MFSDGRISRAERFLDLCALKKIRVVTAESCTGGLISACLTAVPGSSEVVECGFITYSNQAKESMLGVHPDLIHQQGAVSQDVAYAMAQGALNHSRASLAVATTGIAGPGGATPGKPVGLVHIVVLSRDGQHRHDAPVFAGSRHDIRDHTTGHAIDMMYALLST